MQPTVSSSNGSSDSAPWPASSGSRCRRRHGPDVQVLHRRAPWRTLAPYSAWLLFATTGFSASTSGFSASAPNFSTSGVDHDSSFDPTRFGFSLLLLAGSLFHPHGQCRPQPGSGQGAATRLRKRRARSLARLRSSRSTCTLRITVSPRSPRPSQVNCSNNSISLPQLVLSRFILFSLFCFVVSSAFQNPVPTHNIIFDEVGKMAASMTYINVAIPLNISTFEDQISLFQYYLDHHFLTMTTTVMTAMLYFSPKLSEIWHTLLVYAFNIWQTKLNILITSSTTLTP
jgi:hypothetical protein